KETLESVRRLRCGIAIGPCVGSPHLPKAGRRRLPRASPSLIAPEPWMPGLWKNLGPQPAWPAVGGIWVHGAQPGRPFFGCRRRDEVNRNAVAGVNLDVAVPGNFLVAVRPGRGDVVVVIAAGIERRRDKRADFTRL